MKKLLTLLLLVFFAAWSSYGQVATTYGFTQTSGSEYAFNLTSGTVLGSGLSLDDQAFPNVLMPAGFAFKYNGITYSTFGVNTNGSIQLYASGAVNVSSTAVLDTAVNTIAAFNADLKGTDLTSEIRYWVAGAAGSRTLTIQWYRFNTKPIVNPNNSPVNFQVVLHETTNVIEIVYGGTQADAATAGAQVGITGATPADFLVRVNGAAGTEWRASVKGTLNTNVLSYTTTIFPQAAASNQSLHYFWTPQAPCAVTTLAPVGATTPDPCAVSLTWNPATITDACVGTVSYKVSLGLAPSYTSIHNAVATSTASFSAAALLPNTTYNWSVVPVNPIGDGPATNGTFTTANKAPKAATAPMVNGVSNTSPLTGVVNCTPRPTLSWTAPTVTDCINGLATGYKVYFGTDNTPTNIVNGTTQAGTSFTPAADLALNTTYYWRVIAYNTIGDAVSTPVYSFTTRNFKPGAFTLTSIANGSIFVDPTSVSLAWTAPAVVCDAAGATTTYTLTYTPAGGSAVNVDLGTNSATLTGLASFTTYTWNVTAKNAAGNTVSTNGPFTFTTMPEELPVGGIVNHMGRPVDGAVVVFTPVDPAYAAYGATFTTTVTCAGNGSYMSYFRDAPSSDVVYDMPYNVTVTHPDYIQAVKLNQDPSTFPAGTVGPTCDPYKALDFTLLRPEIAVDPADFLTVTVRPGACEYTNAAARFRIQNTGNGNLTWSRVASPVVPWMQLVPSSSTWFTSLPSTNYFDAPVFNTVGLVAGNTVTTAVQFNTMNPVDAPFSIPVIMNVTGAAITPAAVTSTDLNQATGLVTLNWTGPVAGYDAFVNFVVKKDNVVLGSAVAGNATGVYAITDALNLWADAGVAHTYSVEAIYSGGYKSCVSTGTAVTLVKPVVTAIAPLVVTLLPETVAAPLTVTIANTATGSILTGTVASGASFVAVTPAAYTVNGGATSDLSVTFSAVGKTTGQYITALTLTTNIGTIVVPCTLNVAPMYSISGRVTHGSADPAEPLAGAVASVTAGSVTYTAVTNDNGVYTIPQVPVGTHSVVFTSPRYQTVTKTGNVVSTANITGVDAHMWENLYAPACATASVNATDTEVTIGFCLPNGAYEMLYDDGTAEQLAVWEYTGNLKAVKFTPKGWPAIITGAKFFVGNDKVNYPNLVGKTVTVETYKAGVDGMPSTKVGVSHTVAVNNYGWVSGSWAGDTITSGDFFVVLKQNFTNPANSVPIGVDTDIPTAWKSYSKNVGTLSPWIISPFQDYMIHAILRSPLDANSGDSPIADNGMKAMITVPTSTDAVDAVQKYYITRYPYNVVSETMGAGFTFTKTAIGSTTNITATPFLDNGTATNQWVSLPAGWYVYGVQAVYPTVDGNVQLSPMVYTEAVPHKLFSTITVNVKSVCQGNPVQEGAVVTLTPTPTSTYPEDYYPELEATTGATGTVVFDNTNAAAGDYTLQANYTLTVKKPGYYPYVYPVNVNGATKVVDVLIADHKYKPFNLAVDSKTLVATWDTVNKPLDVTFQTGAFVPTGWSIVDNTAGGTWKATTNYSSANFAIPAHTKYAAVNADSTALVSGGAKKLDDVLYTPEVDLSTAPNYKLTFAAFFNGGAGKTVAKVLVQKNGGSWTTLKTIAASAEWQNIEIDLSSRSGIDNGGMYKFAFSVKDTASAASYVASGLAIDDVLIKGSIKPLGFGVFLDNVGTGEIAGPITATSYTINPNLVKYGCNYLAAVAGYYCSGYTYDIANMVTVNFTSQFLYMAKDVTVTPNVSTNAGSVFVSWVAPTVAALPGTTTTPTAKPSNLIGFNIYKGATPAAATLIGTTNSSTLTYFDNTIAQPGTYKYYVTALYSTVAGECVTGTHESEKAGPATAAVNYGYNLAFTEDWTHGQDLNKWTGLVTTPSGSTGSWFIDGQEGNPRPAAKFQSVPVGVAYTSTLESFWINGTTIPATTTPVKVLFDFDMKLDNVTAGVEKLAIDVYNLATGVWTNAATYTATEDFDWKAVSTDITTLSKDKVFKVRFRAFGQNPANVKFWAVDNINVHVVYETAAPSGLALETIGTPANDVKLTWTAAPGATSYKIYRSAYSSPTGTINANPTFVLYQSDITLTTFTDMDLTNIGNNTYAYYVVAVYPEGVSAPSNKATTQIYLGVNPSEISEVLVYPNPATVKVFVKFNNKPVANMVVYNALGAVVAQKSVNGAIDAEVDTRNFAAGAYTVRFVTENGETFSRKFIVRK